MKRKIQQVNYWAKGFTEVDLFRRLGIVAILFAAFIFFDISDTFWQVQDAKYKKSVEQFVIAANDYNKQYGGFPWSPLPYGAECFGKGVGPTFVTKSLMEISYGMNSCVGFLIANKRLTEGFVYESSKILPNIWISVPSDYKTFFVCYKPRSKKEQKDPQTNFQDNKGTVANEGVCKSQQGSEDCYWCSN